MRYKVRKEEILSSFSIKDIVYSKHHYLFLNLYIFKNNVRIVYLFFKTMSSRSSNNTNDDKIVCSNNDKVSPLVYDYLLTGSSYFPSERIVYFVDLYPTSQVTLLLEGYR